MAFVFPGAEALDYSPCRYGASKLLFRGPGHDLSGDYIAVLGGTETYGKYVPEPYATLTERQTGMKVVNLGCANAGPDVYLNDPGAIEVAAGARAVVVQIVGAQNLTNRYYSVHPRRNDRFVHPGPLLRSMFPEVDFTEFHFTRHMLSALRKAAPDRFEVVTQELRGAWVRRMRDLLGRLPADLVLLWMGDRPPPEPGRRADLEHDPMLVDAGMIAAIRPMAAVWVEVSGYGSAEGLVYGPMDIAPSVPGPATHLAAADALSAVLRDLVAVET